MTAARSILAGMVALGVSLVPSSAGAASYETINGSGSSWSAVAIDQWSTNLKANGLAVNYNPVGSASGRSDYTAGQVQFAGSDPPFRDGSDKILNQGAEHPSLGYSYVPLTSGGTAFMYHLTVGGQQVRNLRLSGDTVTKIFTGQITNWSDPQITRDYGATLPNEPITPVVRSDGSGATFMFTRWMAHIYGSQWDAFCQRVVGVSPPCGQTEFYPQFSGAKRLNGSNTVATYISASYGEGSIGYDEYAYAKNLNYPVVKLLNAAGYYVLPSASNVAVALTKAVINNDANSPNYLQQNLDGVYGFNDSRTYPLSSYSYLIVPKEGTKLPNSFSNNQGTTLSTFIQYSLCDGQQFADRLGYAPIPGNLVVGGLDQADKIPGHINASIHNCNNPTIDSNGNLILLKNAPYPTACDKVGAPLNCRVDSNGNAVNTTPSGSSTPNPNGSNNPNGTNSPGGLNSTPGAGGINPETGGLLPGAGGGGNVPGQAVNMSANAPSAPLLSTLTALELLVAIATPPLLGRWIRKGKGQAVATGPDVPGSDPGSVGKAV